MIKIKDLIEEFSKPLKSGMSGESLIYSARFTDLLEEAVKRKIVSQKDANNWDVRKANNLLNALDIHHSIVEADEQPKDFKKEESDYEWVIYWR